MKISDGTMSSRAPEAKPRAAIRDPKLLGYYINAETAANLIGVSPVTVHEYCRRGIWQRGIHYNQPRRRRMFVRDAILEWIEGAAETPRPRLGNLGIDLGKSPELAAEIVRQKCPV